MSRSGIYDLKYGFIPDDDVPQEPPKQTNADRIRSMSDEELAHLLHDAEEHIFTGNLWDWSQWREWLKKEVKE